MGRWGATELARRDVSELTDKFNLVIRPGDFVVYGSKYSALRFGIVRKIYEIDEAHWGRTETRTKMGLLSFTPGSDWVQSSTLNKAKRVVRIDSSAIPFTMVKKLRDEAARLASRAKKVTK